MCGENVLARYGADRLVWLIPACAGKTERPSSVLSRERAHPRVCGENVLERMDSLEQAGSSPRVRGKLPRGSPRRQCSGLIPACAGKTVCRECLEYQLRAHPRVCGENVLKIVDGNAYAGSSPRVRGKPQESNLPKTLTRLIPACAGKTRHTL